MTKKSKNIEKKETKEEKFIRLAEGRTSAILKSLKLLANLSQTNNYSYNTNQVDKIFNTIKKELDLTESSFKRKISNERLFKL